MIRYLVAFSGIQHRRPHSLDLIKYKSVYKETYVEILTEGNEPEKWVVT